MKPERQLLFWLIALAAFIFFLNVFSAILPPFAAGIALAYILNPLARALERLGFSRLAATVGIVLVFVVLLILALILVVPTLASELADFVTRIPDLADRLQSILAAFFNSRVAHFFGIDPASIRTSFTSFMSQGVTWLTALLASVWSGGKAVISLLALLLITPVVAFYLLYDWERLVAYIDDLLPRDQADEIRGIAEEIGAMIAAFVRGQGLMCLVLALFYGVGLALAGINFGFLVGFAAGIVSFIPYLGTAVGLLGSTGLALAQYWPEWFHAAVAVLIFIAGQIINDYVLAPRLLGTRVGLHPVWVIFSFFAFGLLFGFVGLIIAIPAAASIGVLVRYGIARYRESPIYRGREPRP
jgi:predicted PurR-regulated permease PerM